MSVPRKEYAMWNGIKTGFMLVVFMLLALFTSWIVGHAFNLMNKPCDFLVLIGVDLLLLLFLFWFILTWTSIQVFRQWWKSRKDEVKSIPGLSGMLLLAVVSASWISGCTRIAPGYVGIKVSAQSAPDISLMFTNQLKTVRFISNNLAL
jgi:hypothetical protein